MTGLEQAVGLGLIVAADMVFGGWVAFQVRKQWKKQHP